MKEKPVFENEEKLIIFPNLVKGKCELAYCSFREGFGECRSARSVAFLCRQQADAVRIPLEYSY